MKAKQFSDYVSDVKNGGSANAVAHDIYDALTEDERIALLQGSVPFWQGIDAMMGPDVGYNAQPFVMGAVERIGFPGIRFIDGPRGCAVGTATAFPVSMARGATWDTNLEERVGEAIGEEVRANSGNFFGGVCVNLPRNPAWGRAQETYSEEPVILGNMGSAFAKGIQKNAMACVKHYALNSMENARFSVDVTCSDKDLHKHYLPHFRKIIKSGVASVMSCYNSVNGEWGGQNRKMLTEILRDIWGFEGFVITDFVWGMRDPAKALEAGLDIEAPFAQQRKDGMLERIANGETSWEAVKRAGIRIIRTVLKHYANLGEVPSKEVIASPEHAKLAFDAAAQSMTLLKNDSIDGARLLPVSRDFSGTILVVGRLADLANTGDNGSSKVDAPYVVTPYEGIKRSFPAANVVLADMDSDEFDSQVRTADLVIAVVGYTALEEGEFVDGTVMQRDDLLKLYPEPVTEEEKRIAEAFAKSGAEGQSVVGGATAGGDRVSLALPEGDTDLIRRVVDLNEKVVVSVVTAGAVIMTDWIDSVPAVMLAWYSGQEGGNALGAVLSGERAPGGRLPYVMPKKQEHTAPLDINATAITYDDKFGSRLLDEIGEEPLFPLGWGITYTTFSLSDFELVSASETTGKVRVTIGNDGYRLAHGVAQIYGSVSGGVRELLGFTSVLLAPGESVTTTIDIDLWPLCEWNEQSAEFDPLPTGVVLEAAQYRGAPDALALSVEIPERN
ncbi:MULTISPECIES: glycoside hydrolase family 3 protein [Actinotignum]|uniref:Glycoside hydrolase family 3 C-terminal domain-containing protein n=1 Tax=Actinotignum timonense TaxID=1870995 RepID=A0ABU5GB82_9ACTO|nr:MULTISPECIES: glycoside hydrolase family 3 C-terminal domain-containing protein [Actinotignum]MDE1558148.1 glycoside hydrolase family 3 C-terminal domain-containing protein [Actinotignum schaalii]MDE1662818.1 glycoside hydrolase family 3 C-terminal domain-containing protein [Actinotignum schaalii]MDK6372986.1 glycoside hydrolase family 3 C-terminal domain-containing protein [Actinotignum timonense]MDK6419000.1 glycoside hydrolase family 3 C-terminal domain-containing protein [Actinotignum ti